MATPRYTGDQEYPMAAYNGVNGIHRDTVFSNPSSDPLPTATPPTATSQSQPETHDLPSSNFARQVSLRRRGRRTLLTVPEEEQGAQTGANQQAGIQEATQDGLFNYPSYSEDLVPENRVICLKEKIASRNQRKRTYATGLQTFRYVHFPKVVTAVKYLLSFSPWKPFFKLIHRHYGTGVLSYYIFLRWLLFLNIFIFILWSGFVVVPQAIWRYTPSGTAAHATAIASQLTCVDRNLTRGMMRNCGGRPVFAASTDCPQRFDSNECTVNAVPMTTTFVTLSVTDGNSSACVNNTMWWLCDQGVEPVISPGEHLLNFISGTGFIYNTSELFIGFYTNETINGVYDLPLAYLLAGGSVYIISVLAIVVKLGFIYHENYITIGKGGGADIFNKLFAGWDFNISDEKSSKHHQRTLNRELLELYEQVKSKNHKRTVSEWLAIIFLRTLTNLFVFLCLVGGGVIIYYAVFLELQEELNTSLLSATVIAILNVVLPFIFSFLPRFERFQKKSTEIRMTLFRLLVVRVSSLITLIIVILWQIQCTQPTPQQKGTECSADFDLSDIINITANREVCPVCWETLIGQKFYEQALFTFVISTVGTVLVDVGRNIASRIKWPCTKTRISKEFDIPKNILDLVYLQGIVWLGFFFCPLIPGLAVFNFFLIFCVKMVSMFVNLEPSKEAYKAAKKDFTFQFIMLLTLLACMLPVGYIIARLVPSQDPGCGPFRDLPFIYSVVENRTNTLSCPEQAATGFFASAGFIVPLILFLLLLVVGLFLAFRARGRTVTLLSKQLQLENADKSYLLEKYGINPITARPFRNLSEIDGSLPENSTSHVVEVEGEQLMPSYSTSTLQSSSNLQSKGRSKARTSQDLMQPIPIGPSAYARRKGSSSTVPPDPSVFGSVPNMSESGEFGYPPRNQKRSVESTSLEADLHYAYDMGSPMTHSHNASTNL